MTINIPFEIGDKIITEAGTERILSLHIYINTEEQISNVRAFTTKRRYITLIKNGKEGKE